jgi:hypothetical protein
VDQGGARFRIRDLAGGQGCTRILSPRVRLEREPSSTPRSSAIPDHAGSGRTRAAGLLSTARLRAVISGVAAWDPVRSRSGRGPCQRENGTVNLNGTGACG